MTKKIELNVRTLEGHKSSVHSVAVSPDGKYVISGSHDHTVKVWDFEYIKLERKLIESLQNNLNEELIEIRQLLSRNKFYESIRKLDVCKKIAEKEEFPSLIKEIDSLLSNAKSSLKNEKQEKIRKDIAKFQPLLDKKKFDEYINKLEEYKRISETENLTPLIKEINSLLSKARTQIRKEKQKKLRKDITDIQPLLDKNKFDDYIKKLKECREIAEKENFTVLIKDIDSLGFVQKQLPYFK